MSAPSRRIWSNNIAAMAADEDLPPPYEETQPHPQETDKHPLLMKKRQFPCYSMWVLLLLLLAYLFNQLDRYMLAITITPLAQELQFGDQGCLVNKSVQSFGMPLRCNGTSQAQCENIDNVNGTSSCYWDYNGQGWAYQILAGPLFILIYTFAGIFVSFAADWYNRKFLLAFCLIFWSSMTLLMGFAQEYWQVAVLRFALGLGEAGCTPFAASILSDYFSPESRGLALAIYNFGIYLGYSLSYAIGNFITLADINGQGWRWAFILPGIPGIVLGLIIAATVKEPVRGATSKPTEDDSASSRPETLTAPYVEVSPVHVPPHLQLEHSGTESTSASSTTPASMTSGQRLKALLKSFSSPSLVLLCLAGSIRNAGGYVWAYNTQPYFDALGVPKETTGSYLSWIPLVSGCIGVLVGGFISDRVVKNRGLYARIFVLIASQILAAPFAAGALFLDVPWAFFSLIPANIIGEMWVGVTLAVVVELSDKEVRTSSVGMYLFIISNIGGNVPLLVPPLQQYFLGLGLNSTDAYRNALYMLYPGLFALSAVIFFFSLLVVKRDWRKQQYSRLQD